LRNELCGRAVDHQLPIVIAIASLMRAGQLPVANSMYWPVTSTPQRPGQIGAAMRVVAAPLASGGTSSVIGFGTCTVPAHPGTSVPSGTGLFLQRQQPTLGDLEPVLAEGGPLARRPLGLSREQGQRILQRMM
jgi:hypothetical protein